MLAAGRLASRLLGGPLASCSAATGAAGGSGVGGFAAAESTGASLWGAGRAAWRSLAAEGAGVPPLLQRRPLSPVAATGAARAAAAGWSLRTLGGPLAATAPVSGSGGSLAAARRMATEAVSGLGGGAGLAARTAAAAESSSAAALYTGLTAWLRAKQSALLVLGLLSAAYGALFLCYADKVPYSGRQRAILGLPFLSKWRVDYYAAEYKETMELAASEGRLLPDDHPSVQLVRRLGTAMVAAAADGGGGGSWEHVKSLDWEFHVVEEPTKLHQAYAYRSGKVVVNTYMLTLLGVHRNPEEAEAALSFVVAHEVARHKDEEQTVLAAPLTKCVHMLPLCRVYFAPTFGLAAFATAMLGSAVAGFVFARFEQRQREHEADVIALHLLARAGYSPVWSLAYFLAASTLMARLEQTGYINRTPAFLRTHPTHSDRVGVVFEHLPNILAASMPQQRQQDRAVSEGATDTPAGQEEAVPQPYP
ncbi:hypothetical protein HYH03_015137 [Edaphochlamys debaryana]|uniref:Peptidase M48 domain-containing protein n=1 Tax=Edaphochlamys debaryana TaxID=47281 RepID=A0A835XNS4_9CHLO|nr:hypothetical protein HYH03_015137 [Edaphochlamys debaryana]|eukprot:KAG2486173.1 hypothetical protein HYH03_015137 [Edaphochlamys debaryana]